MIKSNTALKFLLIVALGVFGSTACTTIASAPKGDVQNGLASWYGDDFHGKVTSNKEIYDMHAMTAAHKSIPFNTKVRVTNLNNKKSIVVRINDRGPFVKGRIIDMSFAGAKALDMVGPGVVPVRVETLPHLSPKSTQRFVVQISSYIKISNARDLKRSLQKRYDNVAITTFRKDKQYFYRVRINAESQDDAKKILKRLQSDGIKAYILEEYS
ncbi:septal ring lytic transglycosylase RlpA family protein [Acidobacteriota bacterium]